MSGPSAPGGAWVTQNSTFDIATVHPTELDALRLLNSQGYGGPVVFVQWGETLADAERREREAR